MSEYINKAKYEEYKTDTLNRIDNVRDWSHEYFQYLKTVSQNIIDEGLKYFQRDDYYERV